MAGGSKPYSRIPPSDNNNLSSSSSPPPPWSGNDRSQEPLLSAQDQILNDTFGSEEDDEDADNEQSAQSSNERESDHRRLVVDNNDSSLDQDTSAALCQHDNNNNSMNQTTTTPQSRFSGLRSLLVRLASRSTRNTSDGVFTNIHVKHPDDVASQSTSEEPLPSYEEAAADSTPPYWETVIMAPGMGTDDVFVDGLPVGNFFNFIWNMLISVCFQYVGFLLTYLLHSTHAAKNGSKAGLGITLIQYSFKMRGGNGPDEDSTVPTQVIGSDPNGYEFGSNPTAFVQDNDDGFSSQDWISYGVMAVGWFILIGAVTGYVRARNIEQLALESPPSANEPSESETTTTAAAAAARSDIV